ncbi:MAG: tetratricopeptide repeat protein [Planctomycetes bacterium]|nr:tetratricopeptide repeat protein [Planctomycetota bacterium]
MATGRLTRRVAPPPKKREQGGAATGRRLPVALAAIGIFLAAAVAYLPALRAGYIWDDNVQIQENQALRSLDGLKQIWFEPRSQMQYYPLTYTTYWIEFQLWGLEPVGYHAVSVALHALNAVLVFTLLRRLGIAGAWLAGLLFAVHPVHVESVAWLAERRNLLSAGFYLLTALTWLRSVQRGSWPAYAATLPLFLAAMLSKTVACTLPIVLLGHLWWQRPSAWRRAALLTLPYFVIAVMVGLVTVWRERAYFVDHEAGLAARSLLEALLVASRAVWFYAGKLAWPLELMSIYPKWPIDVHSVGPYLALAGALALAALLFVARRWIGRGPLFAVLFFVVTLGPTLGFVDFGFIVFSYVADRFQYLPSIGLLALLASLITLVAHRLRQRETWAVGLAALLACGLLGPLTWRQCRVYQDLETFWTYNLRHNPTNHAYSGLGDVYLRRGDLERAEGLLRASLALADDAKTRARLGILYDRRREFDRAITEYERALELLRAGGRLRDLEATVLVNLGIAYFNRGGPQWPRCREYFQQALEIDPRTPQARALLTRSEQRLAHEQQPIRPPP